MQICDVLIVGGGPAGSSCARALSRVSFRRVLDMNDRALRSIVCSLGGVPNGFPRPGRTWLLEARYEY